MGRQRNHQAGFPRRVGRCLLRDARETGKARHRRGMVHDERLVLGSDWLVRRISCLCSSISVLFAGSKYFLSSDRSSGGSNRGGCCRGKNEEMSSVVLLTVVDANGRMGGGVGTGCGIMAPVEVEERIRT